MPRSLIIGMGIGQLYKSVLTELGHEVITVDKDSSRGADFIDLSSALKEYKFFHTVNICTPNFTHYDLAESVAPYSKIVFVEKPGVLNSELWNSLISKNPKTRFMMVKNNQWRTNIDSMKKLATESRTVNLNWINRDRVPYPGSWFTNKKLAFGGVSRDLMPHLLSLFMCINPDYANANLIKMHANRQWQLSDLSNTDYGSVQQDGVYDVDDQCELAFLQNGRLWQLNANWRSLNQDQRSIEFILPNNHIDTIELGLCPEDAYHNMIQDAIFNVDNDAFWNYQLAQDLWIHKKIETL
jgi:predicted dehydrogenase